jgi:YVTN family beta-propeller protein
MVVDAKTYRVVGTVKVGKRPWGVAVSPDGKFIYTANGTSDDVSIIDAARLKQVGTVKTGGRPWGIVAVQR